MSCLLLVAVENLHALRVYVVGSSCGYNTVICIYLVICMNIFIPYEHSLEVVGCIQHSLEVVGCVVMNAIYYTELYSNVLVAAVKN